MNEKEQIQEKKKALLIRLELAELKQVEMRLQLIEINIEAQNELLKKSLQHTV
jgi:hypothetical protein